MVLEKISNHAPFISSPEAGEPLGRRPQGLKSSPEGDGVCPIQEAFLYRCFSFFIDAIVLLISSSTLANELKMSLFSNLIVTMLCSFFRYSVRL